MRWTPRLYANTYIRREPAHSCCSKYPFGYPMSINSIHLMVLETAVFYYRVILHLYLME